MIEESKPSTAVDVTSYDRLDDWEPVPGQKSTSGGQGEEVQVRHRHSGSLGALKTLHAYHLRSRERRFRMQQEEALLNPLNGRAVPGSP
jgi:hypothetical protein